VSKTDEAERSTTVLDQYKLAVEMVDRLAARRATANSFFVTLNVGLVAIIGFVRTNQATGKTSEPDDEFGISYIAGAGIVLAMAWWLNLRSYRDLSRAKFKVIGEMEHLLPYEPFNDEWKFLKGDPVPWWRRRYAELGTVERIVPWIFVGIYVVAIVRFWPW
jgi:hypothetical protein